MIMSKAERYIELVSDENGHLCDQHALRAVEIAREEVIEETVDWLTKHAKKYYFNKERYLGTDELVEDYKLIMSMKDESGRR
jgi:hypothetical protein